MKPVFKHCRPALCSACLNGLLALIMMLLVEFSISGNLQAYQPYVLAAAVITLLVFLLQWLRLARRERQRTGVRNPGQSRIRGMGRPS